MRITCPSCAAEYDLPGAVPPGRLVRCVRCGAEWAPVAAEPAPPEPEPADPPPAPRAFVMPPADTRISVRTVAPSRAPLLVAWLSSALLLVVILAALYVFRHPIMNNWPPSTRLYTALGLA